MTPAPSTRLTRLFAAVVAALGLVAALASCAHGLPTTYGPPTATRATATTASTPTDPAPPNVPAPPIVLVPTTPKSAPTTTHPAPAQPAPVVTTSAATTASTASPADEILRLTNVERGKAGCAPLTADSRLAAAATEHSADMAAKNYFDHTSLDGRTFVDRIRATGFPPTLIGENIAAGRSTPALTMQDWMNSPGHRANILNCGYTRLGVGYATGGKYGFYWTQDFGRL
jgi:uncharacterized protein YkwD